MFSRRTQSLAFLFTLLLLAQSCSSSQKAGSGASPDGGPGSESAADDVGSIPEDMLADEEGAEQSETTEAAETASTETTDPFADLTAENTSGTDETTATEATSTDAAMAVTEIGADSAANPQAMENYKVKSGDTLMKIAFSLYGDISRWKDLFDWNRGKLSKANQLKRGMTLQYEPPLQPFQVQEHGQSYLIKQGDTLAGIADEVYGRQAKFRKLQKFNADLIKNPNRIFAGFTIFYDITQQEMSEAEARRKEKMAQQGQPAANPAANAPAPSSVTALPQNPIDPTLHAHPPAAPIAVQTPSAEAPPPPPGTAAN